MSTTNENHVSLKWGTLKSWDLGTDKARELMRKYAEIGCSMSAMCQHDTPEQRQIICELIDECTGEIFLDWDGKYVSKEEAKKYVMEYNQ